VKLDLEYKLASEWDQRGTTLDQEREGLFEWEPRHELRHFEQRATTIDRPRVRKGLLILPPEIFRGRPSIVLDGFQFDKQSLLPFHHSLVDRIARYVVARSLSPRPVHRIGLVGHTDSRGTASYNQALGQKRAVAVQKALMERISSLRPALTRRIIFIAQSRGATQPVAPSSTPSGRERNRRVSVFLQLSPPTMAAAEDIRTRSSAGLCCMLAPEILNSLPNLADPANLGRHLFGGASVSSENNGLLYSGAFGFLQIALIRDACDDTKRVIDQLRSSAGAPGTVLKTAEGEARVLSRIPNNLFFDVARAIAYDAALGREIFFYFRFAPGGHNNAFSPENLPSSFLGTMVGVKATQRGGNFEAAVTRELNILISGSRSQPKAETLNAFNKSTVAGSRAVGMS